MNFSATKTSADFQQIQLMRARGATGHMVQLNTNSLNASEQKHGLTGKLEGEREGNKTLVWWVLRAYSHDIAVNTYESSLTQRRVCEQVCNNHQRYALPLRKRCANPLTVRDERRKSRRLHDSWRRQIKVEWSIHSFLEKYIAKRANRWTIHKTHTRKKKRRWFIFIWTYNNACNFPIRYQLGGWEQTTSTNNITFFSPVDSLRSTQLYCFDYFFGLLLLIISSLLFAHC